MSNDPAALNSEFANRLQAFRQMLSDHYGLETNIVSARRSRAEQAREFARGRTSAGPIVTTAPAGSSPHNFGIAADLEPTNMQKGPAYRIMRRAFEENPENGLEWGGHIPNFYDPGHVVMAGWTNPETRTGLKQWAVSGAGAAAPDFTPYRPNRPQPPRPPSLIPVDHDPFAPPAAPASARAQAAQAPRQRPQSWPPNPEQLMDTLNLYSALKQMAGPKNIIPPAAQVSPEQWPANPQPMTYNPSLASPMNSPSYSNALELQKLLDQKKKMDEPDWAANAYDPSAAQ